MGAYPPIITYKIISKLWKKIGDRVNAGLGLGGWEGYGSKSGIWVKIYPGEGQGSRRDKGTGLQSTYLSD